MKLASIVRTLSGFALVTVTVFLNGCATNTNQKAATLQYWQSMHTPGPHENVAGAETALKAGDYETVANLMRTAALRVSGLPVHDVDPELVSYSGRVVQCANEYAAVLDEAAMFTRDVKGVTSPAELGLGLLISLFKNRDKGDTALGHAVLDQVVEKGEAIGDLEGRKQGIEKKLLATNERMGKLQAEEMELRARLSRKYRQEFSVRQSVLTGQPARKN
jgi:hypothetical protein